MVKDKNGCSQFYLEALLSTNGCRLYFSETLKKFLGTNAEVPLGDPNVQPRLRSSGLEFPVGLCHGRIQRTKKVGLRGSDGHQTRQGAIRRNALLARPRPVAGCRGARWEDSAVTKGAGAPKSAGPGGR